ncbi:MAG TPA: hypothetical protein VE913_09765 [Longimicrobium sp.]|nr:hypothetical protein [Longimicrobium sp.]
MDSDGTPPEPRVRRRRLVTRTEPPVTWEDDDVPRLMRVSASCPRCGARPAMRVTRAMVRALADAPADTRVGTYQCQRRGCGAIYDLLAGAYLRAS